MELTTRSILSTISITDRTGRRVGSYLVDRSKDALNRERNGDKRRSLSDEKEAQSEASIEEEAVVFHSLANNPGEPRGEMTSLELQMVAASKLNISV